MTSASFWIQHLQLKFHPEGGYFRETYRATESINESALPPRYAAPRAISTAIYYLLMAEQRSLFHRLKSDEIWHFYQGSPLLLHVLTDKLHTHILGSHPHQGQVFQAVIPQGAWFAAQVADENGYTLLGCTVAPGFDFKDFELADRKSLQVQYPEHAALIEEYT